jgi:hypothetical protein
MVTSILDIDLDYFNLVSDPIRVLSEMLAWANRPVDVLADNHADAMRLMDPAKEVTAAEASILFLHDSESHLLEIISIKDDRFGDKADELFKGSKSLQLAEGIAGWVAQARQSSDSSYLYVDSGTIRDPSTKYFHMCSKANRM